MYRNNKFIHELLSLNKSPFQEYEYNKNIPIRYE